MARNEKIKVDVSAKTNVKKPLSETAKLRIRIGKIIKLNEQLTEENTALVTKVDDLELDIQGWIDAKIKAENEVNDLRVELDGITKDKNYAENAYNTSKKQVDYLKNIRDHERRDKEGWYKLYKDNEKELTSIKSKWWYKLMTWGWN